MENRTELLEILQHIPPAQLCYQDWVNVGMALKEAGYTAADWDAWSRGDMDRYNPGLCFSKWDSFHGCDKPVTGGTLVQMARSFGWKPEAPAGHELDWDAAIGPREELVVVDANWLEGQEIAEPAEWEPVKQLVTYLETLFESTENVGYVTESWERDGKHFPTKGCCDRTAGELIQLLNRCKGDIGAVLGDYRPEVGAWIRPNPLDGQGVKNENVTDFRFALVESDSMDIERQNAIIRELELPVACLVHSGGKSLHAIVRVDAATYEEYRARVNYLYEVCQKNGLQIDSQNRNPSRLSRMPGVMRGERKQFLVGTGLGKASWAEWKEWIESVNDELPDPENMEEVWDDLPALSPPLIEGVLRMGHKMLLAGPSKAGKSFALIEMCCAIAEGREWLGWPCAKGRVLYVNLELDRASCLHRIKDVYAALGWRPEGCRNIDVWNLRGKSVPMDKLAPKLIRRAAKKNYIAIVIDPIYKVITGDENSADQMANFCNQFDRVCTELGAAVIYCHHHSKGSQGGKRSMDRASGSGVFARDPDVLLDLIELETPESLVKQEENRLLCTAYRKLLEEHCPEWWASEVSQDALCSAKEMREACEKMLPPHAKEQSEHAAEGAKKAAAARTAWRIDGTLREFPKFPPINLWFDYPVHHMDDTGALLDVEPEGEAPPWKKNLGRKKSPEERKRERGESLETAYAACGIEGCRTVSAMAEYLGTTEKTVRNRLKESGMFWVKEGVVGIKE